MQNAGDTAEKEPYKGIQGTMSHFYFCSKSPHHIEDDHGLTKYEQHYADDADQQVDRVCLAHCMNNLSQILSLKDHIHSERKCEDQRKAVLNIAFFFVLISYAFLNTIFTAFVRFLYLIPVRPGALTKIL